MNPSLPDVVPPPLAPAASLGPFAGAAVDVVLPVWSDSDHLRRTLWSIRRTADLPYSLIVSCARRSVAENRNAGLDRGRHDVTFFLDDDVLLPPHWMSRLLSVLARRDDLGAVGPHLTFPNGAPQTRRPDLAPGELWEVTIPGTVFVYSRRRVGDPRFDEAYLGSQWEDTDWMWQLRDRGFSTALTGDVHVLHEHAAKVNRWLEENMRTFHEKWGRLPAEDDIVAITREAFDAWTPEPLP